MVHEKKSSILYVLKILWDYTDENHYLTQEQIADKMESLYGVHVARKSVSSSIALLSDESCFGFDINKSPNNRGFALFSRLLDKTQITYLVDCIFSSHSISPSDAQKLAGKLTSTLSIYDRADYSYVNKSPEINRTNNTQIFLNISILSDAIKRKKKVKFEYLTYDLDGNLVKSENDKYYKVNPCFLVNNFGKYYFIANYERYDDISTFRIEYMYNIEIIEDSTAKEISDIKSLGPGFSIAKYLSEHIYMYSGSVITAKVKVLQPWAIRYVFDWFGKSARIWKKDNELTAEIHVDEQAFFYWILQYGENFEVIEPKEMCDRLREHYAKQAAIYTKKNNKKG